MLKYLFLTFVCLMSAGNALAIDADDLLDSVPDANCNESIFKPCICANEVPKEIVYRKRHPACGNRAAAVLKGDFKNIFSIVLRDKLNRDRVAPEGFNNCSQQEIDMGLAKCSAFKAQQVIYTFNKTIHCFGLPGSLLGSATRLTIKLEDRPYDNSDPLIRVCLNPNGKKNLNYTPNND